jgi:hypothetical protein
MALKSVDRQEFPSQTENRKHWQLDTIRANQALVAQLLQDADYGRWDAATARLRPVQRMDRDALLQPGGLFNLEQLGTLMEKDDV